MSYRDSGMTSGPYNIARIFVEGPRETQGYGEEKSSIWWRILLLAFAHLENFCLNGSLLKVMGKVYLLRELFQDMYHSCVQRLPIWPIWVSHIRMVPWNGTNQQWNYESNGSMHFCAMIFRNPFLMTKVHGYIVRNGSCHSDCHTFCFDQMTSKSCKHMEL